MPLPPDYRGTVYTILILFSLGCARHGVGAPPPEAAPADEPDSLRNFLLTPVASGPDTGDLSVLCLDVSPMVGKVERVGISDPYEVLNPPYGWEQIETFLVPLYNQVLVFRADPPRQALGVAPPSRTGSNMGLTQVTTYRAAAGELLRVVCLGESGQQDTLQHICDTLILRACG